MSPILEQASGGAQRNRLTWEDQAGRRVGGMASGVTAEGWAMHSRHSTVVVWHPKPGPRHSSPPDISPRWQKTPQAW